MTFKVKHLLVVPIFASMMPPMDLYYDPYLQPKWIWCGITTSIACLVYILLKDTKMREKEVTLWQNSPIASVLLFYLCMTALHDLVKNQGIPHEPFENPSALALHVCLLIPFTHHEFQNKTLTRKIIYIGLVGIALVILGISQCRASLLCAFLFMVTSIRIFYERKGICMVVLVVLSILAALCFKRNSTEGRLFIIKNTIELVKKNPILGNGKHAFSQLYMKQQAKHFRENPNSEYRMLADNINHPLNEFLYVWVNYGFAGFAILVVLLFGPFVLASINGWTSLPQPLFASLGSIFIFAIFSYPFQYPLPCLMLVACWAYILRRHIKRVPRRKVILGCVCISFLTFLIREDYFLRRWGRVSTISKQGHPKAMMMYYKELYPHLHDNHAFLYDYAIESFFAGSIRQADKLLAEHDNYKTSYDACLLSGDIKRLLHDNHASLNAYREASYMCPCRLAPLYGQWTVYKKMGRIQDANEFADSIMTKQVKIESYDTQEIKKTVYNNN